MMLLLDVIGQFGQGHRVGVDQLGIARGRPERQTLQLPKDGLRIEPAFCTGSASGSFPPQQ